MKKVLLLLADGFEIYEASAFIDVIGWNMLEGDGSTKLFTCGLTKQIRSTFGQVFTVDFTIDEKLGPIMTPMKNWDDVNKVCKRIWTTPRYSQALHL